MQIREERTDDRTEIRLVVADAFARQQEANLVDALRDSDELAVSLVAEESGRILGHVALSRLKSPERALALAPVSVLVDEQRRGIGSALILKALERARELGSQIVFVVGEPTYYSRFGFSTEAAAQFTSPYAGTYFMALSLTDAGTAEAPVIYASAFRGLE